MLAFREDFILFYILVPGINEEVVQVRGGDELRDSGIADIQKL